MTEVKKTFALNVLRGLAALYVVIGHCRWLLWEGYTNGFKLHPEIYSMIDKIFVYGFSLFAYGHEAVMLFFVLSGFVIHYSTYNQSLKAVRFNVLSYLGKRIKRIYPPFLVALLVTWVLDRIGMNLGYAIYSQQTQFSVINQSIHADHSLLTLLGNFSMLQTLYTLVWGSNGPLWSLMYEWWFYILYIPVFFINKKQSFVSAFLIGLMFIVSLYIPRETYKWITVFNFFFAWYLGVIAADIYLGRLAGNRLRIQLGIFIVAVFAIATYKMGSAYMRDYYVAFGFVILLYLSLNYYIKLKVFKSLEWISDFSYTLYVIHLPIVVLMSGWLQRKYNGALPIHFGYVFLAIGISLVSSWALHLLVEKPFVKTVKSGQMN